MHYTFVKRANFITKSKMNDLVKYLNESDKTGEHKYSLNHSKSGYFIKVEFDDGVNSFTDYAAIVKCNHCGGLRELFDGQIEFCYHCDKDW